MRVGMEASGHSRWFERLLNELRFELWIGDAAEIRTKRVRKQKTDRQDAQLLLRLMMEERFPRIWVPTQPIGTCGNCCGIGIGWCRCAPGYESVACGGTQRGPAAQEGLWRPAGRNELESLKLAPWAVDDAKTCSTYWN